MKSFGISNIRLFIKNNAKSLVFATCLMVLNAVFLCINFKTNDLNFGKTFIFILFLSIILEIIFCIFIYVSKEKNWKTEKIFLVLGLLIGIFYVFALPPGRAPDEASHFYRIYELSNGHFVSDISEDGIIGTMEPSSIELLNDYAKNNVTYSDLIDNLGIRANEEEQSFVHTSAYSYNIISYLPHTIGMLIGKMFNLPILVTAYISKIFNLVTCIFILYFCIKYIPILKKTVFFLAFLPITMQAMASLSPDGLTTVMSISLISFVLYTIYSKRKKLSAKQLTLLFIICLCLSMCKIAYAPLCLLLFAIPRERFGSPKNKLITIMGFGLIISLILFSWLLIAPSIQSAYDSTAQTKLILSDPFKYLAILIHSISTNATLYLFGLLGGHLEWFDVNLSSVYILSAFAIFVLLCNKEIKNITTTKTLKTLSILIFTIITILTFTTMFIQWTKVGEIIIDGVQGRYFLPIALLIPIWFIPTKQTAGENQSCLLTKKQLSAQLTQNYYLYAFMIFESIYAITTIACSHL